MKFLIIIPVVLALFIGALSFYLQPNDFAGCGDVPAAGSGTCSKADAIVVVSGGDTNGRTDEGIRLYEAGWADALVFSGAAQDKSGPSNAEAMQARAIAAGVSPGAIFIEDLSENTQQNATNTQEILSENQFQKVILVTSAYHQRRAYLEFEKRTEGTLVLNRPLLNDQDWSGWWWLTPRGWWLATGELTKIIVFYVGGTNE